MKCRNPFFIRSVFVPPPALGRHSKAGVAIPFSSGLCSFIIVSKKKPRGVAVAIPFSSGLCSFIDDSVKAVIRKGRNPFFIRSVFVRDGGKNV